VRTGRPTDDPGTARIDVGEHVRDGHISRDDVAAVLALAVRDALLAGVSLEVVSGEQAARRLSLRRLRVRPHDSHAGPGGLDERG